MLHHKSGPRLLECRYQVMANTSARIVPVAVRWDERCTLSWNDTLKLECGVQGGGED